MEKENRQHYTVEVKDGKVTSILVEREGDKYYRELYKRYPVGMELPLTEVLFEHYVRALCDEGIMKLEEFYCTICNTDPHYAEIVKKVYKKYIKSVIFKTRIHQDAFWG